MRQRSAADVQEQSCASAGRELLVLLVSTPFSPSLSWKLASSLVHFLSFVRLMFWLVHSRCTFCPPHLEAVRPCGGGRYFAFWRQPYRRLCLSSKALLGCSSVRETLKIVQILCFLFSHQRSVCFAQSCATMRCGDIFCKGLSFFLCFFFFF